MITGKLALGEQALNHIAKLALSNQLQGVESLDVRIKTNPENLAQGKLESLLIDGAGLVMPHNRQMRGLKIKMGTIAVSPFKALMGNIQLLEPIIGQAVAILSESNINCALSPQSLQLPRELRGKLRIEQLDCQLSKGQISLTGRVKILPEGKKQQFQLVFTPQANSQVELAETNLGKDIPSALAVILQGRLTEVLSLSQFELKGISLSANDLTVEQGQITIQATAHIEQFPS